MTLDMRIPRDLFTKTYRHALDPSFSVIYRTNSQTVAVLDGDSSEVWDRIVLAGGSLGPAKEYIQEHGKFDVDPVAESHAILESFLQTLENQGLIGAQNEVQNKNADLNLADSGPGRNTERTINLWMAEHHFLYSLVLELTYRCNERCVHCYCPSLRDSEELEVNALYALVEEFESLGGFSLQLTGGELLLSKNAKPLLRFLQGRGLLVSVISNLTLLDEETIELLRNLSPRSVGCSIYSASPELHDSVTTVPGSFAKSKRSICALRSAGIPVVLKTPLMRQTADGWADIEAMATNMGCSCQFDLNITAKNDGGCQPLDFRVRNTATIQQLYGARQSRLHIRDEPLDKPTGDSGEGPLCGAGANGLSISPNGIIHPCIGLPLKLGLYPSDSLRKVWNTSPFFNMWSTLRLNDIPQCRECKSIVNCYRCPGAWYVETGDYLKPNEYTCFLARLASEVVAGKIV